MFKKGKLKIALDVVFWICVVWFVGLQLFIFWPAIISLVCSQDFTFEICRLLL
jgi:hypothetical protein